MARQTAWRTSLTRVCSSTHTQHIIIHNTSLVYILHYTHTYYYYYYVISISINIV